MFQAVRGLLVCVGVAVMWAQPLPTDARRQEQIKKYEELTRDNPRDVEFWHVLGGLYRESDQWDKAIAAETQAVTRHPKYAAAFYGRGKAKVAKQDYAGAVEDFSSAIRLYETRGGLNLYLTLEQPSQEYIDSYRTRGVALSHINKYADGISDMSIALKLRKDDPKLLYERGYLEQKSGRKKDAIPDYYRAGLVYADTSAQSAAEDCVTRLEELGARSEADAVREKLAPKTRKSDLPL